jgi:phage-related protein
MVQRGMEPADWKPMPVIGPGVNEIRVHGEAEYRFLYVAKFKEAIYVLHAFRKQSQKTPDSAIRLARSRYQALVKDIRQ